MRLPDKWYNVLKWVVVVFLPALETLIFGLGGLLGFDATVPCGIIAVVTTFLGALIGVSTYTYNKETRNGKETDL